MTSREQLVKPVVTTVRSNGLVQPRVASEEALAVLNKKPIPTVWGQNYGLPVYDRLPGISKLTKSKLVQTQRTSTLHLTFKRGKVLEALSLVV